jgi:hypothetical protein
VKDGKFEKVLSVQVSDALPPSVWRSRPDPNAGKTGGQAWGMKSLYDALTLVIGRLKTVVDLASGLSKRWHGRSEPKALRSPTIGDCGGLSLSPH